MAEGVGTRSPAVARDDSGTPLADRVLPIACYCRMNLAMRQVQPLFGINPAAVHRRTTPSASSGKAGPPARTLMARDAATAADLTINFKPSDNDGNGYIDAFIVNPRGPRSTVPVLVPNYPPRRGGVGARGTHARPLLTFM